MTTEQKRQLAVDVFTQIDTLQALYDKSQISELVDSFEDESATYIAAGFIIDNPETYYKTMDLYRKRLEQLKAFKKLLDIGFVTDKRVKKLDE